MQGMLILLGIILSTNIVFTFIKIQDLQIDLNQLREDKDIFNEKLDKYYTEQLIDRIKNHILGYYVNHKVEYNKDAVVLYIKKLKWDNHYYMKVIEISYKESFRYMTDSFSFDILIEKIDSKIKEILKEYE